MAYAFKCTRTELYVNSNPIDEKSERLYDSLLQRRLSCEPLQYIIGTAEFMGREFAVNKNTLIPRPETEVLVNEVFSFTQYARRSTHDDLKILDLCTGCGNIAVSLARLMPNSEIIATDISGAAIEVAQKNAITHKVDKNITFCKGDLFQALSLDKEQKFDIIACNPPYVKTNDLGSLQREVKAEPEIALDGGIDGMEFYKRLEKETPLYLKPGGSLFLEIGFDQAQDVLRIFSSNSRFTVEKVEKDFRGIDRTVWISLL